MLVCCCACLDWTTRRCWLLGRRSGTNDLCGCPKRPGFPISFGSWPSSLVQLLRDISTESATAPDLFDRPTPFILWYACLIHSFIRSFIRWVDKIIPRRDQSLHCLLYPFAFYTSNRILCQSSRKSTSLLLLLYL